MQFFKILLDKLFFALQWPIAKSALLSKVYLSTCGFCLRMMGNNYVTTRLINHIAKNSWPDLVFSQRTVSLCDGAVVNIIPHVGEFDFRALFSKSLSYETYLFSWLFNKMKNFDAIIEIGANVGVFSVFFSRYGNGIPVYCFEPSKQAFVRLYANLQANANNSVNPINSAVSDSSGFVSFFEPEGHLTNGSLDKAFASIFSPNVRASVVPTVCASDVFALVENANALLLKIDVEGAEPRVLRSLEKLITQKLPVIIIEVLDSVVEDLNRLEFIAQNYQLYLVTDRGLIQKVLFEANPHYRDFCLLPNGSALA